MHTITVATHNKKQVLDITDLINRELIGLDFESGLCHAFVTHTTAALTTADLDPGTDLDMLDAFENMVPKFRRPSETAGVGTPTVASGLNYRHPHDPKHVPDHILSSLIGSSLVVPIENGALVLGTWQRVVLIEFDGPRERTVIISCFKT